MELLLGNDVEALDNLSERPLLSTYSLLRLYRLDDAQNRLQSLTESIHTIHADAVLKYFQELPPYRAGQHGAWVELFLVPPTIGD